jgi:dienelactone hydrolase
MKPWLLALLVLAGAAGGQAEIKTRVVEYEQNGVVLEGWLVWDSLVQGKRPGVLVAHQWKGLTDYEKKRAEMLAQMGYVAFACDIYGQGVRPKDAAEAGAQAAKFKQNRALFRARLNAGLAELKAQATVDPARVAAIGYCFGGTGVIELARSGALVAGVASFHGGLDSPTPADGKNIRCKVLALHGADDPFVPAKDLAAFEAEMRAAAVDWQLVKYGGAVHSFTDWNATGPNSQGAAYNAAADQRSWEQLKAFFAEIFKPDNGVPAH